MQNINAKAHRPDAIWFFQVWYPQVFPLQFPLIAGTLTLSIDNNELLFALQKS